VRKPDGKTLLIRPRYRREDNIKTDLRERERGVVYNGFIKLRMGSNVGLF
jgi:hypothetical protein